MLLSCNKFSFQLGSVIIVLMGIRFGILAPIILAMILVLLGVGFYFRQGFQVEKGNNIGGEVGQPIETGKGFVEGTVSFIGGLPCNPNQEQSKVSLCDGLYPNYEVVFFKEDKKTIAGQTVTDDEGFYRIELGSGRYYILSNSGKPGKQGNILVTVKPQETTVQDITFDTGVR